MLRIIVGHKYSDYSILLVNIICNHIHCLAVSVFVMLNKKGAIYVVVPSDSGQHGSYHALIT
jgi:hypothetical protein